MDSGPRYLVPFHPKRVPHHFTDVLIIGGGLAGLRAANAIDPKLSVLVVTKESIRQSNSAYAQGGIAGVLDPEDRFEDHIADTLTAGGKLCDREVVEMVVREAPERIRELIDWGTHFDPEAGEISLGARRRPQPRSHRPRPGRRHRQGSDAGRDRSHHAASERANLAKHLHDRSAHARRRLPRSAGLECPARQDAGLGQANHSLHRRRGQVYRETTNPEVATGDGLAIA